jgi:hypothetical protein
MEPGYSCSVPQRLPKIEKLIKRNAAADLGDVEKKLEEQVIKIEKRHKDTLTKVWRCVVCVCVCVSRLPFHVS